jgi:hypothetical protein
MMTIITTPTYCDDLFMDLFGEGLSQSDWELSRVKRFPQAGLAQTRATKRNRISPSGRKIIKEDYFDDSTGIATTKFNSKDIEYIQTSPQSNINDTLKFVPGIRGGNL